MALWRLRVRDLPETTRAIWTPVIAVIPITGPLAFLLVNAAGRDRTEQGSEAIAQALGVAERTAGFHA